MPLRNQVNEASELISTNSSVTVVTFALPQTLTLSCSIRPRGPYTNCPLTTATTMETDLFDHAKLEEIVLSLDPNKYDCQMRIVEIRKQMDESCDKRFITIRQWRVLLDIVAAVQVKCHGSTRSKSPLP